MTCNGGVGAKQPQEQDGDQQNGALQKTHNIVRQEEEAQEATKCAKTLADTETEIEKHNNKKKSTHR